MGTEGPAVLIPLTPAGVCYANGDADPRRWADGLRERLRARGASDPTTTDAAAPRLLA